MEIENLPLPSVLGKKAFLWKVVLESLVILAIVINEMMCPNPFEKPSLG